jgi:hypothetical protein
MASSVPEMQHWFPDWDGSDSEGSVRSTRDEVADHPAHGEPFAHLSLDRHYERNDAAFKEVLEDKATVTKPVTPRDVVGGGPRGQEMQRGVASQQGAEGPGGEDGCRLLITRPTASGMDSRVLHPSTYRDLPSIPTINELAKALNVPDWKEKTKALRKHTLWPVVERALRDFRTTPLDKDETVINSNFSSLMRILGYALDLTCNPDSQRSFGVGGILAGPKYAFRGKSDTPYEVEGRAATSCAAHGGATTDKHEGKLARPESAMVLTCEFKTAQAFPYGRVWYHGSRGLQLLGGLWSGWVRNPYAPALLLSQQQFKLLVVRNPGEISCACASSDWKNEGIIGLTVHQFPPGYESRKTSAPDFLDMLVVILLATSAAEHDHPTAAGSSAEELHTPTRLGSGNSRSGPNATPNNRYLASSERKPAPRRSERNRKNDGKQASQPEHCVWIVEPHVIEELERTEAQRVEVSEGDLTL